ncbi:hypothetical protein PENTCL1PPCAC_28735, partial [Pristionchus entomophagus]
TFLLLFLLSPLVTSCPDNECLLERQKEQEEDQRSFDCRSCKALDVDSCPEEGYDCAENLKMTSKVLNADDDCVCSWMKCADSKATLLVEGKPVDKIHCINQTWMTSRTWNGAVVDAAVCALKCGATCVSLPNQGFETDNRLSNFAALPADDEHKCGWGTCEKAAYVSNVGSTPVILQTPTPVEFTCNAASSWSKKAAPNMGDRYTRIQCIKNSCQDSTPSYETQPSVCGIKYTCYEPQLTNTNEPTFNNALTCKRPNALRYKNNINQSPVVPVCSLGQWTDGETSLNTGDLLLCIDCPDFDVAPSSKADPVNTGTELKCPAPYKLKIKVDLFKLCPSNPSNPLYTTCWKSSAVITFDVVSVVCDEEFQWDTKGSIIDNFVSLKDAVKNGLKWKALCTN